MWVNSLPPAAQLVSSSVCTGTQICPTPQSGHFPFSSCLVGLSKMTVPSPKGITLWREKCDSVLSFPPKFFLSQQFYPKLKSLYWAQEQQRSLQLWELTGEPYPRQLAQDMPGRGLPTHPPKLTPVWSSLKDLILKRVLVLERGSISGGDAGYTSLLLGPVQMWGPFTESTGIWLHSVRKCDEKAWKTFFFFVFLGLHLQHMEVPRLRVKLEL